MNRLKMSRFLYLATHVDDNVLIFRAQLFFDRLLALRLSS